MKKARLEKKHKPNIGNELDKLIVKQQIAEEKIKLLFDKTSENRNALIEVNKHQEKIVNELLSCRGAIGGAGFMAAVLMSIEIVRLILWIIK